VVRKGGPSSVARTYVGRAAKGGDELNKRSMKIDEWRNSRNDFSTVVEKRVCCTALSSPSRDLCRTINIGVQREFDIL